MKTTQNKIRNIIYLHGPELLLKRSRHFIGWREAKTKNEKQKETSPRVADGDAIRRYHTIAGKREL